MQTDDSFYNMYHMHDKREVHIVCSDHIPQGVIMKKKYFTICDINQKDPESYTYT